MDNPHTVAWSHSDRQADFYELPTDGADMHQALGWLLQHYGEVKLWMGLESNDGAELFLTCSPANPHVVQSLLIYDDGPSIFEEVTGLTNRAVNQ